MRQAIEKTHGILTAEGVLGEAEEEDNDQWGQDDEEMGDEESQDKFGDNEFKNIFFDSDDRDTKRK